jgi:conjugative relaxase-like TrwC/TraI family protein
VRTSVHNGGGLVLNIARIGPGGEDYYLSQVVSVEDYYIERGEAPGRWDGALTRELRLEGRVESADLKAVLAGRHPSTGEVLAAHPARKVTGFDLVFRAPKSVSLAWGLADDPQVSEQFREAHRAAVQAAVGYLEREAGYTRRGAGGAERVAATGLAAATFEHRTSRAGDPLLHTHVVVANLVHTADDGAWRTLDSRGLFRHAKTAGVLYQAQLRQELTARLGLAWEPVINGHADLAGFDRDLIEAFSQRRAQIVERLDEIGMDSPAAAQIATYATRQAKELQAPEAELRARWTERACEHGFEPSRVTELLHVVDADSTQLLVDTGALTGLAELVAGDDGLTSRSATFARRDAVQAVAAALPAGGTVAEVERLTDRLLADGRVVTVGRGEQLSLLERTPTDIDDPIRYTTTGLLATEADAIKRALGRLDDQAARLEGASLDRVLRRHHELGADQTEMVRRLCTSGAGVDIVVGKAGSGKTHALAVAHEAWQAAGVRVVGCSLAARAARGLHESSGIPSSTLARLLATFGDGRPGSALPPGGVVVVDEAGMIGTRQLATLLAHAEAQGTKVVLVGDPAQLSEIDAGGLFRGLVNRLPTVELTENRRQRTRWERAVVDQLRTGRTRPAVAGYAEHGRLTVLGPDEVIARVLDRWELLAEQHGPQSVVVIARTRRQVDQLNQEARRRRIAAGHITGPEVRTPRGQRFAVGDRVVCLRNDRRLDVDNGTQATVTAVQVDGALTVRPDGATHDLLLPVSYLEQDHLTHAYAITGHKAQGVTVDHALVVADETIDGEWGYVAMSRGRHTNHLYLVDADLADTRRHAPEADDPHARLARRLAVSHADTTLADRDVYDPMETAIRWQRLAVGITEARKADRQRRELNVELDRLVHARQYVATSYARDQAALDQASAGLSRLTRGARAEQRRAAANLEHLAGRAAELDQQIAGLRRQLHALGPRPDIEAWQNEAGRLSGFLDAVAADAARTFEQDPPEWLTAKLGPPPDNPEARGLWRDGANRIQAFRLRWQIDDPEFALGQSLAPDALRSDRQTVASHLREATRSIELLEHPERGLSRYRAISR